jgi:hypothetical protein
MQNPIKIYKLNDTAWISPEGDIYPCKIHGQWLLENKEWLELKGLIIPFEYSRNYTYKQLDDIRDSFIESYGWIRYKEGMFSVRNYIECRNVVFDTFLFKSDDYYCYIIDYSTEKMHSFNRDEADNTLMATAQLKDVLKKLDQPTEILSDGSKFWQNKEGELHRGNDKPAIEYCNGTKVWKNKNNTHRENDKPAIEYNDGRKEWYINDKFIKQNYDKKGKVYNYKLFDENGDEIKTTTAQLRNVILNPKAGDVYTDGKNLLFINKLYKDDRFNPSILNVSNKINYIGSLDYDDLKKYLISYNYKKINNFPHKYNLGQKIIVPLMGKFESLSDLTERSFELTTIEIIKLEWEYEWKYGFRMNDSLFSCAENILDKLISLGKNISYREAQLRDMIDKPTRIDKNGDKYWESKEGYLHRGNDKPAIEFIDGGKEWFIDGKFIKRNYDKNFYKTHEVYNDKFFDYYGDEIKTKTAQLKRVLDELNKPTEILSNGTKIWRNKEGQKHRGNDKPAIEWSDGKKSWYINGELHRDNDKPAVEYADGGKIWYIDGKFIKRNYDNNDVINNDKFFDEDGKEVHL